MFCIVVIIYAVLVYSYNPYTCNVQGNFTDRESILIVNATELILKNTGKINQ